MKRLSLLLQLPIVISIPFQEWRESMQTRMSRLIRRCRLIKGGNGVTRFVLIWRSGEECSTNSGFRPPTTPTNSHHTKLAKKQRKKPKELIKSSIGSFLLSEAVFFIVQTMAKLTIGDIVHDFYNRAAKLATRKSSEEKKRG